MLVNCVGAEGVLSIRALCVCSVPCMSTLDEGEHAFAYI